MKSETEQMLIAGWYAKKALDQRPDLKIQLAALVRDIWATAALVEGMTVEELESIALSAEPSPAAFRLATEVGIDNTIPPLPCWECDKPIEVAVNGDFCSEACDKAYQEYQDKTPYEMPGV